jgi:hypothetical protein
MTGVARMPLGPGTMLGDDKKSAETQDSLEEMLIIDVDQ